MGLLISTSFFLYPTWSGTVATKRLPTCPHIGGSASVAEMRGNSCNIFAPLFMNFLLCPGLCQVVLPGRSDVLEPQPLFSPLPHDLSEVI